MMLAEKPKFKYQEVHGENEIMCPYCREWINKDFVLDRRCPNCHKIIQRKCVICGQFFFVREIGNSRQVCYDKKCIQKFRYHCGKGDRYWRTEAQKKNDKYRGNKK
jgi:hypothetical protein